MTNRDVHDLVDQYLGILQRLIERFRATQRERLRGAGTLVADCVQRGGVVHLFGTGHSHMIAEEVFYRAGGLVPVDAMLDASALLSGGATRSTETERTAGAAAAIAAGYDLRAGDAGVVISHSGRNPAPVEMARLMHSKGLGVIAITSLEHSRAFPPRDPSGARLFEVADIVLDSGGGLGDATLELPGALNPVGPTSTVLGAAIVQALMIEAMAQLAARGVAVVNLPSANTEAADLAPVVAEMARYRGRIRHL